ncbi:DddA-like double-stranded DNA deaminase toxin [Kineosporia sp. NBRC 101731]|uniref:DddA-like double-stranded DNA deaminase toxin n=1 Tax=Kineosporia sp. NBRC 101731 TaxID=3032199 RepID=UPI0024A1CF24|nr:DddA-like double-stranded DNA deaminase toxin [Kineosporia sp. NBRC 101731]GLY33382.1 hypothetical protein Kisp02_67470 [Kineosporia sp. NBRC 101731]
MVAEDFLAHGWDGLAWVIEQVGEGLYSMLDPLQEAHVGVESAVSSVEQLSAEPAVEGVRNRLAACSADLATAGALLADLAQALEEAAALAMPAHQGFADSLSGQKDDFLAAIELVEQEEARVGVEQQAAQEFGTNVEQRGSRPPDLSPPHHSDLADAERPGASLPDWVRTAGARLPIRTGKGQKTAGLVFDAANPRSDTAPVVSGEDLSLVEDLNLQNRRLRRATALLSHVESHVAAGMRRGRYSHETVLVINNRPCRNQFGCDELLPYILPRDSQLHVYVSDEHGTAHFKTYRGTGELTQP